MMSQTLTVTEVARHFAEYINRVAYRGECFVLVRGNKPIAELRPVAGGETAGGPPRVVRLTAPSLSHRGGAACRRSHRSTGGARPGGGPRPVAVLIDASILIEAERGRLALESHVAQRQDEEFFLSVITASELLHGVHRAVQPEVRTKRAAFVEGILERFPLLPVDLATARAHAQVWAELMAAGQDDWAA